MYTHNENRIEQYQKIFKGVPIRFFIKSIKHYLKYLIFMRDRI